MSAGTAARYTAFARDEARGSSPTYERLAHAVAGDARILALLDELPPAKRQPNLLFGVLRLLGAPVGDPGAARDFVVDDWPAVPAQLRAGRHRPTRPAAAPR
jgi:hypothetical protein